MALKRMTMVKKNPRLFFMGKSYSQPISQTIPLHVPVFNALYY